jgi:hypothetical protein
LAVGPIYPAGAKLIGLWMAPMLAAVIIALTGTAIDTLMLADEAMLVLPAIELAG